MPNNVLLEVCATTADEAAAAVAAGADRIELCAALEVGGVTPSMGAFREVRGAVGRNAASGGSGVVVLVRPRSGGFVYTDGEFVTLCRDAEWFLGEGADAVVVGVLNDARRLHRARCRELVALANGRAVLHRCFDELADLNGGLEEAIDLGFARVLTSGGAATAAEGAGVIAELVRRAAGRIEVLPGGGVNAGNVAALVRAMGCGQVHGSFRGADGRTDAGAVAAVRAALMGERPA